MPKVIHKSILDEMYACLILDYNKRIERVKKHIELGHRGSALDPRDYHKELNILLKSKQMAYETYQYLKKLLEEK